MTETRFSNNFDFLRIIAALMVLIYHSYALLQLDNGDPLHCVTGAMNFGTLGVSIFFVISGFFNNKKLVKSPFSRSLLLEPASPNCSRIIRSSSIHGLYSWSYNDITPTYGLLDERRNLELFPRGYDHRDPPTYTKSPRSFCI